MRRRKQFLAALLSLAMVATAAPINVRAAENETKKEGAETIKMEFSETEKSDGGQQENPKEPKPQKKEKIITLKPAGEDTPAFKYSEAKELKLELTNTGTETIENIKVKPKVATAIKNWPFEIEKISYEKKVDKIEAGKTAEVVYKLIPRATVESKYYKVTFQVAYGENSYEQSLFVKMEGKPEEPKKPDKHPDIDITIEGNGNTGSGGNTGGGSAGGGSNSDSGFVSGGGGVAMTPDDGGSVSNGGSVTNGESSSSDGLTPRVIVTGFSTDPGEVRAGDNFTLVVHLKNTSKKTAVKNMLFDFNAPAEGSDAQTTSPAFLPSSGSSTVYLDGIKANGTKDISIDLNAKADLVQKPYSIEMSVKYEDGKGGQYDASSSISVPVKQDARFEFSEFELSSETVEVGGEINAMCNIYNLGRVKLYNLKARFEGEGIKSKELFIGNVEPGATAVVDGMIMGEQATTGDGKVKLLVTYEDEAGVPSSAEKELTLFVTEPVIEDVGMEDPGMVEEQEEKGFPIIPVVIGGVLVALVGSVIVIKKRKKKKVHEEEEEFLEDELDRLTEDE